MRTLVQMIPFVFFSVFLLPACSTTPTNCTADLQMVPDLGAPPNKEFLMVAPGTFPHLRVDLDGDGVYNDLDCDDNNPHRAPGLTELCDDIDNDCNGQVDEGYHVDEWCRTGDDCEPVGLIRCNDDGVSSSCQWSDLLCL